MKSSKPVLTGITVHNPARNEDGSPRSKVRLKLFDKTMFGLLPAGKVDVPAGATVHLDPKNFSRGIRLFRRK